MIYSLFVAGGPVLPPFDEVLDEVTTKLLEFSPICLEYKGHRYFINNLEDVDKSREIYNRRNMTASELYQRNIDFVNNKA